MPKGVYVWALIGVGIIIAAGGISGSGITSSQAGTTSGVDIEYHGDITGDESSFSVDGVMNNAVMVFGNHQHPTHTPAITVRNLGDRRIMVFGYDLDTDMVARENIQFTAYDSTGTHIGTFSEDSLLETVVDDGATVYLVLEIDTHGMSPRDDLDGDFQIRINE